ncbi:kinase-like domain-containing protein [Diplogelasinospora grovesii]|uniref:cyclin-dependent kinase n=1 Tax=Diplogelasinospora grovesii TaxID=303347 RepID=A0AAN6NF08_9PEZI|nr:kinase-like domain-containing protein [Diplogelasinospora grovesii]
MASKASRWASNDDEDDAAAAAKIKKEKEEKKKRLKAEKARQQLQLEAERQAAQQPQAQQPQSQDDDRDRPMKRRRLSPEQPNPPTPAATSSDSSKLLRFESGAFGRSRDVEEYDKLNDIEEGAYGFVARARHVSSGRIVALKRLKLDAKARGGLPVTGLREIQILKDCRHRNVVQLREVVTSRLENIFLVLEFVEHDLKSILEDMPEPFLASEIKTLLLQLASGVAYLHDHWILHRDLKTSNLLLNNRGQLKIADFGMARYVGDPPPQLTQLVVTLWYRAPELLLGASRYGQAIDMWSVGCIFGELLTREPLLQGKNEVDELSKIFALCGIPTDESWPGFRRLPNAKGLRLPPKTGGGGGGGGSQIRAKFPLLTAAGVELLGGLLALDPEKRPTAKQVLEHEYFKQDPRPKQEAMFPTFPSKAGQEKRRRRNDTPNAPVRGQQVKELGAVDFSGIFAGREAEERGGGFSLRMV